MKAFINIIVILIFLSCACGKKTTDDANAEKKISATNPDPTCLDTSKINTELMCIEVYEPVCGCNGKTYSNTCYAEREGVVKWEKGECKIKE